MLPRWPEGRGAASPQQMSLSILQPGRLIHQFTFNHLLDDDVRMLPLHELAIEGEFPRKDDPAEVLGKEMIVEPLHHAGVTHRNGKHCTLRLGAHGEMAYFAVSTTPQSGPGSSSNGGE